ncbi:hypothetical protein CmeUKMEL1_09025 [Cryptosporidium meleagridis]|uniref:Uncharacterized protein n=1 Tax=Cryptosporidium meleagridis TaxID=93969 RepID=A0A2P4Z110_9CRYT|nr:hypothetical protein CmeUKMEL1_09025 [Cryptosporidium meleagridis]
MKSIFVQILIILSILSYSYASSTQDLVLIEEKFQRLKTQCRDFHSDDKRCKNTFLIGKQLLLMATEQKKTVAEYPLLGTFLLKGKCAKTKLFFYHLVFKTFVVLEYRCKNKIVEIQGTNGEYLLSAEDFVEMKKLKGKKQIVPFDFSFAYKTLHSNEISKCPSVIKNFDAKIIPENFNIETDQKYKKGDHLIHRGFYLVDGRKRVQEDSKESLTYALFASEPLNYAIPIQSGCKCISEKNKLLICTCDDFNYHFDVEEGILSVGETKLLTANIRGLKVLTSKTNTELLALIDTIQYENEQHENKQVEENEKEHENN